MSGSGAILVVDDDLDIVEMMEMVLVDAGYEVVRAFDGAEALRVMRTIVPKPSLVLLDLMMPGMNGWELRAEQTKEPVLDRIPVLVISGDGRVERKAGSLGVAGYIPKPFSATELLDAVNAAVRQGAG